MQVCGASHGELLHTLPIAFPLEMLTALYEKTRQLNVLGLQNHISELNSVYLLNTVLKWLSWDPTTSK